ncbi:MAG: RagB/SusD family nutrient uptake outer membrane protein [Bacteroidales bacterium]|nr:RagB/SusD family nutrient uptake outer membrane protein [Bacteroidales bacterium]MCF8389575.1 RagB/SusD family nutrient uptake outer membrane protein [Bacteroidales bacterium]
MKKLNILFILTLLAISSCNEDEFLTETPMDDIFAENLYLNYDGFMNGLNGLYALVRQELEKGSGQDGPAFLWIIGVDNAYANNERGASRGFNDYNFMNSENDDLEIAFNWLYSVINSANTIIDYAEGKIEWQGESEAESIENKNKVIAHARLIRAWAYRHLTGCWGAVPLNIQSGKGYRSDWERTPVGDIQAVMEQDWIFARNNLDMVEMTGFANSAVASHYLAELYLTQGRFEESIDEAKRVINSNDYQLMTERFGPPYSHIPNPPPADSGVVFMDLFAHPTREDGNLEVLWTINNAHETFIGSMEGMRKNTWNNYYSKADKLKKLDAYILYRYNGGRGRCLAAISDSAYSWYESFDDRFSEYAFKKYYVYPKNEEAETDFEIVEYTKIEYGTRDDLFDNFLWPWPRKYESIDPYYPANSQDPSNIRPEMYLRLADTYLILAEALYKNENLQESADYLNEIRQRSNASPIDASDVTIEFILKERSRELISEEHRRYALTRNNLLVEWAVKYNPTIEGVGINIFEYNNLLPLPQTVIDANTDRTMLQNPGYY